MKYNKYILTSLLAIGVMFSCDEGRLELQNPNQSTPDSFFTIASQSQAAVNAMYANLQTRGLYSRHIFFSHDNMSHENAGNPQLEADKRQYLDFAFDASHGAIRAFWESCYRGINKCNYVLDNEEAIRAIADAGYSDALRDNHIGEAKFMRALYYFYLASRYGGVPLVLSVPTTVDGTAKSTQDEVYNQIEADLTDATGLLFDKSDAAYQNGRASSGAAWALLGKVRMYRQNYSGAQTAFSNLTGYDLTANYIDNFLEETEYNEESIFEVSYDIAIGHNDRWNSDASGQGLIASTFRGQEYGCFNWFNVYPSDDLLNEYEAGDPRFDANFYTDGSTIVGGVTVRTGVAPDPVPAGEIYIPLERTAGWRKYQNYYKKADEQMESGINFRVIRYADILLMLAEIENEIGTIAGAVGYLNQIRDRVGMPQYGTAAMDAAGYPVTTNAEVFAAIVHERKVELAGEQLRFPDLVRWGIADEVLGASGMNTGFTPNKNELFPIPQQEINANNALSNDDQNPGYF